MFVGVEYGISSFERRIEAYLAIEPGRMGSAVTIIFAREDLSIPGTPEIPVSSTDHSDAVQTRFFNLVSDNNPDVIVLDFIHAPPSGTETILTIRQRSAIPIIVACNPGHPMTEDYRIAGAADCIAVPIDIFALNQLILRVLQPTERAMPLESKPDDEPSVDGTGSQGQQQALASAVSSW
jgi:DNA-binding NtrC family response regulator